jgi:ketosteroid isomerase-like protein
MLQQAVVYREIHDARAHTCMMHASSTAYTKIGKYANEYGLFLTFTEDGNKVTRIEEFVDSAYTVKFFQKLNNVTR